MSALLEARATTAMDRAFTKAMTSMTESIEGVMIKYVDGRKVESNRALKDDVEKEVEGAAMDLNAGHRDRRAGGG